jgi:hypothetical protein
VRNSFAEKCGNPVSRMIMVSEEEVLDPGACQEDAVAAALSGFHVILGLCVCGCPWMRARICPCVHRSKQAVKLAPASQTDAHDPRGDARDSGHAEPTPPAEVLLGDQHHQPQPTRNTDLLIEIGSIPRYTPLCFSTASMSG